MTELERGAQFEGAEELRNVVTKMRWPTDVGAVPSDKLAEAALIVKELQSPGDPPNRHLGEVATVIVAESLRIGLIVMDDRAGRRLARSRGVRTISTAQLAVHMTAIGELEYEQGLQVFLVAAPTTTADFDASLGRAKAAVGSARRATPS